MTKAKESKSTGLMTVEDVAELLGVTDRTIRNWMKEKGMPSVEDGRARLFKWSEVLPWYVRMRVEEAGNDGKQIRQVPGESYEEALRRRTVAEANLKELEEAKQKGLVVAVADVERNIADVSKGIQTKILGWPSKMVGRLHGIKDRAQLFAVMTASMRELCFDLVSLGQSAEMDVPDAS